MSVFTEEDISIANQINLVTLMEQRGYPLERASSRSLKIPNHGGLHLYPERNQWYSFTEQKGGGPIQLLMYLEQRPWRDAVRELLGYDPSFFQPKPSYTLYPDLKDPFILPDKNDTNKHAAAYLTQIRHIDSALVREMINAGKLYEDIYRNCVFVGVDEANTPRYASIRSTNTYLPPQKRDVLGSDKSYGFAIPGSNSCVEVFEAPIEVLSYCSLRRRQAQLPIESHLLSLGGVMDRALEMYLVRQPEIKEIHLRLNQDDAGQLGSGKIKEKYGERYEIHILPPQCSDYNEDLTWWIAEEKRLHHLNQERNPLKEVTLEPEGIL